MKFISNQKKLNKLLIIITTIHIALAIIGAFRSYSFVPIYDMWDSYIGFFNNLTDGGVNQLWVQHNEHRIALSKILFWLDITYFSGNFIFLLICNYIFAALSLLLMWLYLKEALPKNENNNIRNIIFSLIAIFIFSWAQYENFTRGFQTQFFLAQLIPLAAFYFLHLAKTREILALCARMTLGGNGLFFLACLCGILSIGTMANGVLALPLMTLLAIFLTMKLWRILLLATLSISCISIYFYHYNSVPGHGSVSDAFLHHPIEVIRYCLMYFGGPIYSLTGKGSYIACEISGILFSAGFLYFLCKKLKFSSQNSLELSLIAFLLFIGGSAIGTAAGKLAVGIDASTSGRYNTPVLMAWSALLILYSNLIAKNYQKNKSLFYFINFLIIAFCILQLKAIRPINPKLFEYKIAALAAELGAEDYEQIKLLHPAPEAVLRISKIASKKNISVFGNSLIKDVDELIGDDELNKQNKLLGNVDKITLLDKELRFAAIEGLVIDENVPEIIHIVDKNNIIVGYALTKKNRFKGYLLNDKINDSLDLIGINNDK